MYADERIVPLNEVYDADGRLMDAAVTATTSLALLMLTVVRRWPTGVCLVLALTATLAINVSVPPHPGRAEWAVHAVLARRA